MTSVTTKNPVGSNPSAYDAGNDARARAFLQAIDAHAIIGITDPNRIITFANDKLCEISGYSRDELIGQHYSIIRSDYHSDAFFAELEETISRGIIWHGDIRNRAKDGSTFWTATTVYPVQDENGTILEYVTIRNDITERKQAEEKLRSKEEQFKKAFHAVPALFAISDPETGTHYDVNETWKSVLGYTHEEAMSRTAVELGIWVDPDVRKRFVDLVEMEGSVRGYEAQFKTKYGEIRDMLVSGEYLTVNNQPRLYVSCYDITDRKKASDRLHAVIDSFPGGIAAFDENLTLRLVNDQFYDGMDIPRDRFPCGCGYEDLVRFFAERGQYGNVDVERWVAARKEEALKFSKVSYERTLIDGTTFSICNFPLPEGGFVATYTNITDRKLSEAQNHRLVRIVENALNEVYVFDAETLKFLQANKSACKNLGYTRDELFELTPYDIKVGFDRESFEEHIEPLRSGRVGHLRFETVHMRRDGSLYDVDVTLQRISSETRPVIAAIIEDISDKKQADEELQLTRKRFQDMAEVSSDWFWETNEHHRFTYISERFSRVTNVDAGLFIGKTRHKVAGSALANWDEHLSDLQNHQPFRDFRYTFLDSTGRMRHWSISGIPVFDSAGTFRGYRGTGTDRTEEMEAKAELVRHRDHLKEMVQQATRELNAQAVELRAALEKEKELNELQSQFMYVASHEFRTPLAIIDSSIQRLMRHKDVLTAQEVETRCDKIQRAVGRMSALMESALSAARSDAGLEEMDFTECDLNVLLLEVCQRQQELSSGHSIIFEPGPVMDSIRANASALDQVFTNLLSNAVKYSPDSTEIEVKSWLDGEHVVVSVRDHGRGIDADDLPKMFRRFFRAKTARGIAGTGIGLDIARTAVERHDGSISVASEPGKGSIFTVRLPVSGPSLEVESAAA